VLDQGLVGLGAGSDGGLPLTFKADGLVLTRCTPDHLYVDVMCAPSNVVADETVRYVLRHVFTYALPLLPGFRARPRERLGGKVA
jgi:hypothetical protein